VEGLKERSIRGGAARMAAQVSAVLLRLGTLVILARLLEPAEFGLVAMVTVVTGVIELFATGGLTQATVQRAEITESEVSALFWVNVAIGVVLAIVCMATAPILQQIYHEPRTTLILAVLAPAFIVNATGVQHMAVLQRQMRYVMISAIEIVAQVLAAVVAVVMALLGWGYWALVANALVPPLTITIAAWLASGWRPRRPHFDRGIVPMLHFGGTITLNNLVCYIGYNLEKMLIGRSFGSEALGLYGRAHQLANVPTSALINGVGGISFAALARLQHDHARFKNYFLKGYVLVISTTLPAALFCFLLAEDIVLVMLGSRWIEAADVLRLLSPTILIFGMINPLSWLMQSIGLHKRSLQVALVLAPITVASYLIGLPYGPSGVALAFSTALALWLFPSTLWCVSGTPVSISDLLETTIRPLLASLAAAMTVLVMQRLVGHLDLPLLRLTIFGGSFAMVYAAFLLFVLGQKDFYLDILRVLRGAS